VERGRGVISARIRHGGWVAPRVRRLIAGLGLTLAGIRGAAVGEVPVRPRLLESAFLYCRAGGTARGPGFFYSIILGSAESDLQWSDGAIRIDGNG